MGGVVKPILNPVTKVVDKAVGTDLSGSKALKESKQQLAQQLKTYQDMSKEERQESKASALDEQQGARMRGARRRGRQLLSDARLNPEAGVETLGGGNNLG
jgi:hypothetical protein